MHVHAVHMQIHIVLYTVIVIFTSHFVALPLIQSSPLTLSPTLVICERLTIRQGSLRCASVMAYCEWYIVHAHILLHVTCH